MKIKIILFTAFTLFILIGGMGCEQDNIYYEGKVITLNSGDGCNNIIEISKSIPQGLSVNSTITFDPSLYNRPLKIGDTVSFKIIKYEEWTGSVLDICIAPKYVGQLEFYSK
jgi:hypothetical protein